MQSLKNKEFSKTERKHFWLSSSIIKHIDITYSTDFDGFFIHRSSTRTFRMLLFQSAKLFITLTLLRG